MPKKGRYAHLKGSSAYYPFGARTKLRRRQRRHVVLLRVVGLALLVPAAVVAVRQIVFRGGQPQRPDTVLADTAGTPENAGPVQVNIQPATAGQAAGNTPSPAPAADGSAVLPRYADLAAENPDMVGWLTIEAAGIDYPVMQTPGDNEYYLRRGFDRLYSPAGSLFLDEQCSLYDPATANWLIYGHNMHDGSMFAGLLDYADEAFYRQNPTFAFDTLYEQMEWQVVLVLQTELGADELPYYTFFDAASREEWQARYDAMAALALYDTGVTAECGDQLLTLSTCGEADSSTDSRFAVVAKRIE